MQHTTVLLVLLLLLLIPRIQLELPFLRCLPSPCQRLLVLNVVHVASVHEQPLDRPVHINTSD
jgi:hypothetical protein